MKLRAAASVAMIAALILAGSAHARHAAPPSPTQSSAGWQSCGAGCRYSALALPDGTIEIAGAFDCGAAACWNGDPVEVRWNVGAASCLSATATPYSPASDGASVHSMQVSRPLKAGGASFEAGGFQIVSGTGLRGFFFNALCRR